MNPVEEAFGSPGFRRVVLPGIVLTLGIPPLVSKRLASAAGLYAVNSTLIVVVEILFFGLVLSSGLQWIYYVYEGFRLQALTSLAARFNKQKLASLQRRRREIQKNRPFTELSNTEQAEVLKIYEYLHDFPVQKVGNGELEHIAERPTRLGNVIAAYELYAESRYGVDGVFYWRHLLNLGSDAARKEFEEQYAFAESLVLSSFSGAIIAAIHVVVLIGYAVALVVPPVFTVPTAPTLSFIVTVGGVVIWYLFYRASLPAHRDAGAAYCAIVDAVMPKLVECLMSTKAPLDRTQRDQIAKVTAYLKDLETP